MALERLFRRNRPTRKEEDTSPAGLWLKCDACQAQIYRKDLVANVYLCPECGFHHRMPVSARIDLLADEGSFEKWSGGIQPQDPLEFEDTQKYSERIEKAQKKSENPDAIVTGAARRAHFRYRKGPRDYILDDLLKIPAFVNRELPRWRALFQVSVSPDLMRLGEAAEEAKPEIQVDDTGSRMHVRIGFLLDGLSVAGDVAERRRPAVALDVGGCHSLAPDLIAE